MLRAALLCLALFPLSAPPMARAQQAIVEHLPLPVADDHDDFFAPERNAVVVVGGCTGTLITDRMVLTAGHCFPRGFRSKQPPEAEPADCSGLEQQAEIQERSWEDPLQWYPAHAKGEGPRMRIRVGHDSARPRLIRWAVAYSLPRCADLALLELDLPLPRYVAQPVPVATQHPFDVDRFLALPRMRHSGWGMPSIKNPPSPIRRTGKVSYWGRNQCQLVGLPPTRSTGRRVLPGDSGAPLLMELGDAEVLVGVLWGSGNPDPDVCGHVVPRPPVPSGAHGSYTPTWRATLPDTEATDIGAWLQKMAPEADHR